jgi:hypothetical protein
LTNLVVSSFFSGLYFFSLFPKRLPLPKFQRSILASFRFIVVTTNSASATSLFKLLNKYRPETKIAKKQRLLKIAEAKANKQAVPASHKPHVVKYGLNHITGLVEQKKAKLVAIAHDVDPVEVCDFLFHLLLDYLIIVP